MEYLEVKRDIDSGKQAPVYFFFGEEPYYTDQLTAIILRTVNPPEARDFDCDVFQAEEVDVAKVVAAASSFPMMAERRLVVLKSVQKCSSGEKESLAAYIRAPSEATCLVLTAGKIDRRQTFYASLIKNTVWVESKPLYDNQAVKWVELRIKENGFRISEEAASLLVRFTGNALWTLANEVEKLITFCWDKRSVEVSDVAELAGFSRKYNTWELSDSLGQKQFDRAVGILQRLMQEKQSPVGLIMEWTRRIVLLMRIRVLLDKGEVPERIQNRLRLSPFFSRMYTQQAGRYSLPELEKACRSLAGADEGIKTGTLEPLAALVLVMHDAVFGETRGRFFS